MNLRLLIYSVLIIFVSCSFISKKPAGGVFPYQFVKSTAKHQRFHGELVTPVKKYRLTSKFGWRGKQFHDGVDMAAPIGTTVYAAHAGTVTYVGHYAKYGLLVAIDDGEIVTLYAHLNDAFVQPGEDVAAGVVIATVGQSGNATGPHLHFELRQKITKLKLASIAPPEFK